MKPKFVDTNIFLEALARRGEKSDRSIELLENGKANLWTTELVVAEVEWVLRSAYLVPKGKVVAGLKRILDLPGLVVERHASVAQAIGLYEALGIDFTDCLNVVKAAEMGVSDVYSYDKDFNKVPTVKRLEP